MSTPLLSTKLTPPPSRPQLVMRPRLLELLDQGVVAGLTLLSAPAGFGKTTLVVQWLQACGISYGWLSLDPGDNDPARFLTYLLAALRRVDPAIGEGSEALLRSFQPPPPEALLTSLINDLASTPQPFVLILDDYHVIYTLSIHQQLGFLLDHRPSQMSLLIATREDPPLPVARLRAQGGVVEVRQSDLSFSESEGDEFLRRVMGVELAQPDVARLCGRTEGWIAGLQLAALTLQVKEQAHAAVESFSGSNRYVLDYLIEEAFQRQPPGVQNFLLSTSILDRFCAPLCDAVLREQAPDRAGEGVAQGVTPEDTSQEMLEYLDRVNLFVIALDLERKWYRYHHLFAELLRHRLEVTHGDRVAGLHRRASAWYLENGFVHEAVQHALAAQDWKLAADLASQGAGALLQRGEFATLLGWFAALPHEIIEARARLCLDYAWPLLLSGRLDDAEHLLLAAGRLAPAEVPPPGGDLQAFQGQLAAAESYLQRAKGDMRRSVEAGQRALALLPQDDFVARSVVGVSLGMAYWHGGLMARAEPVLRAALAAAQSSGNEYARLAAQVFLGRVMAVRGELRNAAEVFRKTVEEGSRSPIVTIAHLDLAALEYEWNYLPEAARHLQEGMRLAEWTGNAEFRFGAYLLLARLRAAQGAAGPALEAVRTAYDIARAAGLAASTLARAAACAVEVALAARDPQTAEKWAVDLEPAADAHPFYRSLGLASARLLMERGENRAASEALRQAFDTAQQAGWIYGAIAARVLQAVSEERQEEGLKAIADALVRAEAEGFVRTFLDAGRGVAALVARAAQQGIARGYSDRLLLAIEADAITHRSPLVEPLSERELEVLRLVAAGLSNRAIAFRLILGEGTVKTHVHNISGKLAATNRTEAVARARELGLI